MRDGFWQQVKQVFGEVAGLPESERRAALERACGDDHKLRKEVEALLRQPELSDASIRDAVGQMASEALSAIPDSKVDRMFGPWKLRRLLARGGMGAVYLADRADGAFEQQAAVKLVNAAIMSPAAMQGFNDERQILARLQHVNVARLIDGGTSAEGEPWLAMEYIDGERIDAYCKSKNLGTNDRLALFRKVCAGVDYAHRNLVVHRDIKPSNILVDESGEPKLLDFGVAKLFDDQSTDATVTEHRAMTPKYASPEQLRGEPLSTATDVYSMSVLLYELLTGLSPYEKHSSDAVALHAAICAGDFERPSTALDGYPERQDRRSRMLIKSLHGDLDNIILKGLRTEVNRRYESVRELADDIDRYLRHEPVLARPDTLRYRASKFVQRRRVPLLFATGALGILLVTSALFVNRIITERNVAETERDRAEQVTAFLGDLLRGADRYESQGEQLTLRDILDNGAEQIKTQLVSQPVARAQLMQLMGETYNALSLNREAGELSQLAFELRKESLGARHPDTLASMRNAAHYSRVAGADVEKAIESLIEVRELQIEVLGEGSHEVASTRFALALALRETGQQLASRDEFQAAYDTLVALPVEHPDHQFEPTILNQLGNVSSSLGEPDQAIEYFQQALSELQQRNQMDHPVVSALYSNLGAVLRRKGRLDEAQSYMYKAVEHTRRILGEESEDFEVQMSTLGRVLSQMGRFDEANEALGSARDVAIKLYGKEHPYYAWHLVNLARLRQLENRFADSVPLLEEALPIYKKAYGDYHPFMSAAEVGLAESMHELGEPARAVKALRTTLATMQEIEDHERHTEALGRGFLGRSLAAMGQSQEAELLMTGALSDLREQFGDEHALVAQTARYLVDFLDANNKSGDADPYRSLTASYDRFYPR